MKPYSFNPTNPGDTGCCPGHDWPRTYRWSGRYRSRNHKRVSSKLNKIAKRARRRVDRRAMGDSDFRGDGK